MSPSFFYPVTVPYMMWKTCETFLKNICKRY
nr:MAG TPA: hypothetical protein [Caudoviricetes sp.]